MIPIMYIMHKTVTDSVWHHRSVFLEQFLQHDMLKPLFWQMCTHTAVTVYSVTVWRVDLIREDGMRPLTPTQDPQRLLRLPYLIGLSDTVIISRTQEGPPKKLEGHGGGGGVSQQKKNALCVSLRTNKRVACMCLSARSIAAFVVAPISATSGPKLSRVSLILDETVLLCFVSSCKSLHCHGSWGSWVS